jgi:hypothetical protein
MARTDAPGVMTGTPVIDALSLCRVRVEGGGGATVA